MQNLIDFFLPGFLPITRQLRPLRSSHTRSAVFVVRMRSELDPAGVKLQAWVHGCTEQAAQCAVNVRMAAGELMSVSFASWTDFSVMLLFWSMSCMIIIYSREPEVQELKHSIVMSVFCSRLQMEGCLAVFIFVLC